MPPKTPPPRPPESDKPLAPLAKGRVFSAKLSLRLRAAANSSEPAIRETAEGILDAERDVVKALVTMKDVKDSKVHAQSSQSTLTPQAKVIPFPALSPIEELPPPADTTKTGGFQPVVYDALPSESDDSGLDIITAGQESDEKVCRDFGIDESPEAQNKSDLSRDQAQSLDLLDRILKKTGTRSVRQLTRRLEHDPNAHLQKKGGKGKK